MEVVTDPQRLYESSLTPRPAMHAGLDLPRHVPDEDREPAAVVDAGGFEVEAGEPIVDRCHVFRPRLILDRERPGIHGQILHQESPAFLRLPEIQRARLSARILAFREDLRL